MNSTPTLAGARARALTSVSAAAVMAMSVVAQAGEAQTAQASQLEEIAVTGTRVQRDGYQAPTPLTVLNLDQIKDASPANIAEYVMTLPQLVGNTQPQTARGSTTAGGVGLNTPQARNLGTSRTLIL